MASALADDEKELEVNVDYPAIRITNIFVHVNPHLHTATHGFEKSILTSGYPIKQQSEGFFIVFASTTARAKFKKNSKHGLLSKEDLDFIVDKTKYTSEEVEEWYRCLVQFKSMLILSKHLYFLADSSRTILMVP